MRRVLVAAAAGAAICRRVRGGASCQRRHPRPSFAAPAVHPRRPHGKPFTADTLKGRWSLVLAGFTHCSDVCPFTLANLEQVVSELGLLTRPDRLPAVIFLGVDPDRDRANLKDYVVQFHPDFLGVTGAIDQIDRALKGVDAVADSRQAGRARQLSGDAQRRRCGDRPRGAPRRQDQPAVRSGANRAVSRRSVPPTARRSRHGDGR